MSKQNKKKISKISSSNSLINDELNMDLNNLDFNPITDEKEMPFRNKMTTMFRDSPVPNIFNEDISNIKEIKSKLEEKNEGWFAERKKQKKGGKTKKKNKHNKSSKKTKRIKPKKKKIDNK